MPSGGGRLHPLFSDGMQQRLRWSTLRPEIDQARQNDTRVQKDAHGQRFRSSSTRPATSTGGRSSRGTVGRATSRRPTLISRGPAATRSMRIPNSSVVISISDPAARPTRSRIPAGMTTRPALSMVVRMPLSYPPKPTAPLWCARSGRCGATAYEKARIAPAIRRRLVLFFAVRGEDVEVHRRAEPGWMDLILGHAGENELIDVRARHIEMQCWTARVEPRGGGGDEKPAVDQVTFVPGCGEGVHEVRSRLRSSTRRCSARSPRPDPRAACRTRVQEPRPRRPPLARRCRANRHAQQRRHHAPDQPSAAEHSRPRGPRQPRRVSPTSITSASGRPSGARAPLRTTITPRPCTCVTRATSRAPTASARARRCAGDDNSS